MFITTINPATGRKIKDYAVQSKTEVETIINEMQNTYCAWRSTDFAVRQKLMTQLAELLRSQKTELAELIAQEMGKPVAQGQAEIEKCAWVCEHYASHAEHYLQTTPISSNLQQSFVTYQPLGIVFAIMPWNFPFWQVFRSAAPSIMAGNGFLLKHAPITTGCGLRIQQLFVQAGFPEYLMRCVVIPEAMASTVIQHPCISGVTLTGSVRAGRAVAMEATQSLKKIVLELGGNDPYLILRDADVEQAAEACVKSRLNNSGQVCIAAKRLIVEQEIAASFKQAVLQRLDNYSFGDPLLAATQLGPLARADLREQVHQQVQKTVQEGAQLLMGGTIPETQGFYYPVTVLDNVTSGMCAFVEEIFGPVFSFITACDQQQAIDLANDSCYGLSASVFTRDVQRGIEIATHYLQVGSCNVNGLVSSDPRLPFGGVKSSGFGRELSQEGIREFVNIKTVCVV